jgi:hypothetical protein
VNASEDNECRYSAKRRIFQCVVTLKENHNNITPVLLLVGDLKTCIQAIAAAYSMSECMLVTMLKRYCEENGSEWFVHVYRLVKLKCLLIEIELWCVL